MNTNRIIKFVERNVDGCGTDAEVTILVKTRLPLSEVQGRRIWHCLVCFYRPTG